MRSVLHNSIRENILLFCDQCLSLFKSKEFHAKTEPPLSAFSDSLIRDKSRGDLSGPWLNCKEGVLDLITVDPCNDTVSSKILDDQFTPLDKVFVM
ncbi:hypothetical protein GEMRC1_000887 [Eukaryota sp. GEM-RC1]